MNPEATEETRVATPRHETIHVSVVRDFTALARRKAEWNALVEQAGTNTIFQTFECHSSWWTAFGQDFELFILLAESGGKLVGIAPLMFAKAPTLLGTERVVQFIGTRSFDYADFIVARTRRDVLTLLVTTLADHDQEFDLLYLRDIPETSETFAELRSFFSERQSLIDVRVLYDAPTRLFNDAAADRKLPNKKSLRRHYNYFKRAGQLAFKNCATVEEALQYLNTFFEQHIRRRAATDTASVFHDARSRCFFRQLVQSLASTGWLLFSVVSFNEKPIAMHFGFEYGGRITWYKPAFDPDYAKHSPGEVLIKYLLEYALERKVSELDFTKGAEPFKYRFANHTRHNYVVRVFRRRSAYRLSRLALKTRDLVERLPWANRIARILFARWRANPWL